MRELRGHFLKSSDIVSSTSPRCNQISKNGNKISEKYIGHEAATGWLISALMNSFNHPKFKVVKSPSNLINPLTGKGTRPDVGITDKQRNSWALFEVSGNMDPDFTLNRALTRKHKQDQWTRAMEVINPNERYANAPWSLLSVGLDWFIDLTERMLDHRVSNKQIQTEIHYYLKNYGLFVSTWNND